MPLCVCWGRKAGGLSNIFHRLWGIYQEAGGLRVYTKAPLLLMSSSEETRLANGACEEESEASRPSTMKTWCAEWLGKIPFGIMVEFALVVVCEADLVLSTLVGVDYISHGHTAWGYIIVGLLANTALAIVTTEAAEFIPPPKSCPSWYCNLSTPLKALVILPLAPVLPLLHWIASDFSKTIDPVDIERFAEIDVLDQMPKAAQDEARVVAGSAFVMGYVAAWVRVVGERQLLLIVESVAGAMPQAVVQLLALSCIGKAPSTLQVIALTFAIISVVSKGHFLSLSFSVAVFAAKYLMLVHDVVSTIFVFTCLRTEGAETLFGVLHLTPLTYAWSIKVMCLASAIVLFGVLSFAQACRGYCRDSVFDAVRIIAIVVVGVIGFVPGLLLVEAAKLSLWILIVKRHEPALTLGFAHHAMLLSFLQNRGCWCSLWPRQPWRAKIRHLVTIAARQKNDRTSYVDARWGHFLDLLANEEKVGKPQNAATECDPCSHPSLLRATFRAYPPFCGHRIITVLKVLVILSIPLAVFSIAFPFLWVATYGLAALDNLQLVLFVATSVLLTVVIALVPAVVQYTLYCIEIVFVTDMIFEGYTWHKWYFARWVLGAIAQFHVPPASVVLAQTVPVALLPQDVSDTVASFISVDELNLKSLGLKDCEALRDGMPGS